MQIAEIDAQTRVAPMKIAQIAREHPVMIAQKRDPIFTPGMARHQIFDHAGAVRAPVHQIADVNDGGRAVTGLIGGNPVMRGLEKVKLAVNVANGVGSHSGVPVGKDRGFHTPGPPWDIWEQMKGQGGS